MAAKKSKRNVKKARGNTKKAGSGRGTAGKKSDDAEIERLSALLELMKAHELVELELCADGSVRFSKSGGVAPVMAAPPAAPAPAGSLAADGSSEDQPGAADPNVEPFLSPMVGTFYRAASPEAGPYVSEGDAVEVGSTLCIVEAMKVFNEIKAEFGGTVVEILVENGEAVEYGQPLFMIRKAS